jgi:hypothetical protein
MQKLLLVCSSDATFGHLLTKSVTFKTGVINWSVKMFGSCRLRGMHFACEYFAFLFVTLCL